MSASSPTLDNPISISKGIANGTTSSNGTTTTSTTSNAANGKTPIPMNYYPQIQNTFNLPLIANDNAFLGDVASSDKVDGEKAVSCGFFRLERGSPLDYVYTYHEMKIILEGSFKITDDTGRTVTATKGDVFYFPEGAKIRFETDEGGLAFYTGQRKEGAA